MLWTVICFVIAALVVAADQITKVIAVDKLMDIPGRSYEFIPGVLHFNYIENDGMALGLLDNSVGRIIFMTVSVIAIIGLSVYVIWKRPKSKLVTCAIGLIIGGGIGNMIDRLFYVGKIGETKGEKVVRDFIDFRGFGNLWVWVFNVADACVCIGGALLFVWCICSLIKESIDEKNKKAAAIGSGAAVNTEIPTESEHPEEKSETTVENEITEPQEPEADGEDGSENKE